MKLHIDTKDKIIKIDPNINLGELIIELKKIRKIYKGYSVFIIDLNIWMGYDFWTLKHLKQLPQVLTGTTTQYNPKDVYLEI